MFEIGCGGQIWTADAPGLWDRRGDHPPRCVFNALRPSAVIIVYQKFRQVAPTSLFITYTFHPLPDRDRSRIANAG